MFGNDEVSAVGLMNGSGRTGALEPNDASSEAGTGLVAFVPGRCCADATPPQWSSIEHDQGQYGLAEQRAQVAQRKELATASSELATTRAELERERDSSALQSERLQSETQRRERAEEASEQAEAARQRAEEAQARALAALEKAGEVKHDERGTVITLSGAVIFASGESQLTAGSTGRISPNPRESGLALA